MSQGDCWAAEKGVLGTPAVEATVSQPGRGGEVGEAMGRRRIDEHIMGLDTGFRCSEFVVGNLSGRRQGGGCGARGFTSTSPQQVGTGKIYRQGRVPMNRNKTLSFCLLLIPSCDVVGGCLLPRVSCSVFTAKDHAAPIFVGPVAPTVFLVHSGCSVNIAPWKELGLC